MSHEISQINLGNGRFIGELISFILLVFGFAPDRFKLCVNSKN